MFCSYKSTLLCISHPPEALAGAALLWGGERTGRKLKLLEGKTLAEAIGSTDEAINGEQPVLGCYTFVFVYVGGGVCGVGLGWVR